MGSVSPGSQLVWQFGTELPSPGTSPKCGSQLSAKPSAGTPLIQRCCHYSVFVSVFSAGKKKKKYHISKRSAVDLLTRRVNSVMPGSDGEAAEEMAALPSGWEAGWIQVCRAPPSPLGASRSAENQASELFSSPFFTSACFVKPVLKLSPKNKYQLSPRAFLCGRSREAVDWWGKGRKFTARTLAPISPPRCFSFDVCFTLATD